MKTTHHIVSLAHCLRILILAVAVLLPIHSFADDFPPKAHLAWSQQFGGVYDIYYRALKGGQWGAVQKITQTAAPDLIPAVVATVQGEIWLVWSSIQPQGRFLYYSRNTGQAWSPPQKVPTAFGSNTAPTLFAAGDGSIWLAFAGYDGQDDEIFFTRFQNGRWEVPRRVHVDDQVPDVQPLLGRSGEGKMWIKWRSFSEGRYRNYISFWQGNGWGQTTELTTSDPYALEIRSQLSNLPALPEDLSDKFKSSIHLPGTRPLGSMPLKMTP